MVPGLDNQANRRAGSQEFQRGGWPGACFRKEFIFG